MRLAKGAEYHSDPVVLREANIVLVAVPTPVDSAHTPDFGPLICASQAIDPTGRLLSGEEFQTIRQLKGVLAQRHGSDFYRTLTEKLLTYALGRGLEYYDVATVDHIVQRLEKENGRASVLLSGIVESAAFQKTRRPSPQL